MTPEQIAARLIQEAARDVTYTDIEAALPNHQDDSAVETIADLITRATITVHWETQ